MQLGFKILLKHRAHAGKEKFPSDDQTFLQLIKPLDSYHRYLMSYPHFTDLTGKVEDGMFLAKAICQPIWEMDVVLHVRYEFRAL